jgi:hypothetical protein
MEFIPPPPDQPELLAWWNPLLAVAKRAREADLPWLVCIDEFELKHEIVGSRFGVVRAYVYEGSGREVVAGEDGATYRFIPYRRGPAAGRVERVNLRTAMESAYIPHMPVEVIHIGAEVLGRGWPDQPPRPRRSRPYRPLSHPYLRRIQ